MSRQSMESQVRKAIMAAAVSLAMCGSASAAVITWDGGGATNFWSDAFNWSGDALPTASDTVRFNGTSSKNSTADIAFSIGALDIASSFIGQVNVVGDFTVSGASVIAGEIDFTGIGRIIHLAGVTVNSGIWRMTGATSDVRFADGSLMDVNGTSNIEFLGGSGSGARLRMRNVSGGVTQWSIDVDNTSTVSAQFVELYSSSAGGTGAPLVAFDSLDAGGNTGWNFQISAAPIPEPETYAMLLAGLGLLGWHARRRKQKLAA